MDKKQLIKVLKERGLKNLSGLSTKTLKEIYDGTYNPPSYEKIYREMIGNGDKKIGNQLTKFYWYDKIRNVRFPKVNVSYNQWMNSDTSKIPRHPSEYGNVKFFQDLLVKKLGKNWDDIILRLNEYGKPEDISKKGVKRLGVPGRQGTVVLIRENGIDYAIKVAPKSTSCGELYSGRTGYYKQAVMQQYASEWKITPPVYAVHCDGKSTPFMVMPALKSRLADVYMGKELSLKHQKQWFEISRKCQLEIGIWHNDGNCLNVMIDQNDDLKLIDWDRAIFMDKKRLEKHPGFGLTLLIGHGCFRQYGMRATWLRDLFISIYARDNNEVIERMNRYPHHYAQILEGARYVGGKRKANYAKDVMRDFLPKLAKNKRKNIEKIIKIKTDVIKKKPPKKPLKKPPKKKTPKRKSKSKKKTPKRRKSKKKTPKRKSKRKSPKRKSVKCKYGYLKRPVRDKKTGKMRYCKKAPRSTRKSKKSVKCKYGYLKRPVRDKETGKMRYCKKAPRSTRKSKRKSKRKSRIYKKRPRKKIEINYSPDKNIDKNCVDRSALHLRAHQRHVVKYLDKHKGILAIHGTGTGKTLTAVTASQCFLDANPDKKVIVVSPAALVHNFAKELGKYRNVKHSNSYEFYSYERFLNKMYENGLKEKYKDKVHKDMKDVNLYKPINLKGNLLIVDEAHNLRNIKSKKTIAVMLASYTAAKRILLTATPVVNNITDLIPIINMVNGKKIVGSCKEKQEGKVKHCLRNITSRKSNIDEESQKVIVKYLKNRIDIVDLNKTSKDFPKMREHKLKVEMTEDFYRDYDKLLKDEELNNIAFKNPHVFYNGYRRLVNSVGIKGGVNYYSMKINKSIPIIRLGKTIIYTNWLGFGVNPLTEALDSHDIDYRIISGSVSQKQRIKAVQEFNENKVNTLIITKAGGEGLDLKEVRNVIVVDPPWNPANLDQIIGRAVRFQSHKDLPPSERFVDIYYMELEIPKGIKQKIGGDVGKTGDTLLYSIILRKNDLLNTINSIFERIQIK